MLKASTLTKMVLTGVVGPVAVRLAFLVSLSLVDLRLRSIPLVTILIDRGLSDVGETCSAHGCELRAIYYADF